MDKGKTKYNLGNTSELHNVATSIDELNDSEVLDILTHMYRALLDVPRGITALGIAAPQIGISKRVILVDISRGSKKHSMTAIINPIIVEKRLGRAYSKEGCLSYPGLTKIVPRYKQIRVEGYDKNLNPIRYKLRGLDSYVVQHEIDHLNGITIAGDKN